MTCLKMEKEKIRRIEESDSPLETLRIQRTRLTQEEFARRCGISLRTYQRWVYGETIARPTLKQIKAICLELGIKEVNDLPDDFSPVT
jgi:transcriptional regulator with XRE-family HTH domain